MGEDFYACLAVFIAIVCCIASGAALIVGIIALTRINALHKRIALEAANAYRQASIPQPAPRAATVAPPPAHAPAPATHHTPVTAPHVQPAD